MDPNTPIPLLLNHKELIDLRDYVTDMKRDYRSEPEEIFYTNLEKKLEEAIKAFN